MAGPQERRNVDRREDTSMGHDVKWDLSVGDLVHLTSRPFKKTYRTFCKTAPSTWKFELSLPEVREDGPCSMSILLERTDSLPNELEGCIWVDICDPNDNLIFKKQTFSKTGMLQGHSIQETVEMTPLPNMREAMHRNPVVIVTLMISFCHEDSESD